MCMTNLKMRIQQLSYFVKQQEKITKTDMGEN